jgi:DegV family protein with EDD domain
MLICGGARVNKSICQIVDSSGSLPRDFLKRHGICEVPFYFKFDGPDYARENVDWGVDEFYRHMEEHQDLVPSTACPNLYDWLSVFERQKAAGFRELIVTTISAKLSGSFQTAINAKRIFEDENSGIRLEVIDSNTCACGQAALEIAIAKMIEKGINFDIIVDFARDMRTKTTTLFAVHSLKYMKAGGRIGGAAAFLGGLIHIKPVCEFVEGVVHPIKTVRGRKASLAAMADVAISRAGDFGKKILVVQNARFPEDAAYLIDCLRKKSGFEGLIYKSDLGITVGAHSGPGAIGVGLVEDPC